MNVAEALLVLNKAQQGNSISLSLLSHCRSNMTSRLTHLLPQFPHHNGLFPQTMTPSLNCF